MPSANSAKIEKTPSPETNDFIKQCISLVEKKVRNLEKRKAKLDGYKALSATKELISDQLAALSKYDQVVEMLEQSKEIQKNVQTIHHEFIKQSKKNAKREQQERQQHEVQRIKEVLLLQDILNNMGTDEIRQDFLNGSNGAIKLSEKELNQLDELYKLISPERGDETYTSETPNFNELLSSAAEHLVLLLDGKNKEILGTTYKSLKENIMKVHESGYFDPKEEKEETEGSVKDENVQATEDILPVFSEQLAQQPISQEELDSSPAQPGPEIERTASPPTQQVSNAYYITGSLSVAAPSPNQVIYSNQTSNQQPSNQTTSQTPVEPQAAPLPDVLMQARGSFNFLQESQVDIESPHMDPAVVAAHPMVPQPLNYQVSQNEAALLAVAAAASRSTPSNSTIITPVAPAQQADYDPARPIPTQTFTNQNFAAMQNMMTAVTPPAGYTTAVVPNPAQSTQLQTSVGLMMNQNQPRNISVPSSMTETPPGYPPKQNDGFSKPQSRNYSRTIGSHPNPQDLTTTTGHYQSSDENEENNEGIQNSYNRNRANRGGGSKSRGGSGASNGYGRGPRGGGNYSNGRGGSNYYGNRDRNDGFSSNRDRTGEGYSNNSRRGGANSRGGQRNTGRINSSGGRGGVYRSQD